MINNTILTQAHNFQFKSFIFRKHVWTGINIAAHLHCGIYWDILTKKIQLTCYKHHSIMLLVHNVNCEIFCPNLVSLCGRVLNDSTEISKSLYIFNCPKSNLILLMWWQGWMPNTPLIFERSLSFLLFCSYQTSSKTNFHSERFEPEIFSSTDRPFLDVGKMWKRQWDGAEDIFTRLVH